MKSIHKEKLSADLKKYSEQIGILPNEIPRLIFNRTEYMEILSKHGRKKRRNRRNLGYCSWSCRAILVDGNRRENYIQYRHTLVHELVHFRFPELQHGPGYKWFNQRIREILRGARFQPRHIHFFEGHSPVYIDLISGYSNEEIEQREQWRKKRNEAQQKSWEKYTKYWNAYREAKMWALVINSDSDRDYQSEQLDRTQYTRFGNAEVCTAEVERIMHLIKLIVRDQQ